MSHGEHGQEKDPIILTSGRRIGKGLAIVVITLSVGAAILLPYFHDFYKNPPPVSQIPTTRPPTTGPPAEAGTTTIAILQGASTQGNPDFNPDDAQIPLGNKILWDNQDTIPHTATSGTDPNDTNKGKLFDTGIIIGGEKSKTIELSSAKEGDTINYFCTLHPYMIGKLTITKAGGSQTEGGATTGPSINILEGASTQGNRAFDPDPLTAKKGDEINVVNQDTIPHTITSGTKNSDPDKGKLFDTNIILGGESAKISLAKVDPGEYDYFCTVHEYMKGKLTVE